MTEKYDVKGEKAHPIYKWAKRKPWNSAIPKWNFHKILINKDGKIIDTYGSLTKPMSKKIINELKKYYKLKLKPSYAGVIFLGRILLIF